MSYVNTTTISLDISYFVSVTVWSYSLKAGLSLGINFTRRHLLIFVWLSEDYRHHGIDYFALPHTLTGAKAKVSADHAHCHPLFEQGEYCR
jgi:hypothetical protein